MSDSDFALRLASSAELQEMVQTLTRERDEARRQATALVGEGESKECWCQWEAGDSPCPTHGMDEEKGGRDA